MPSESPTLSFDLASVLELRREVTGFLQSLGDNVKAADNHEMRHRLRGNAKTGQAKMVHEFIRSLGEAVGNTVNSISRWTGAREVGKFFIVNPQTRRI